MQAEIINIGNSKGLRIPKAILSQCKIKNIVDLTIKGNSIIITPTENLRAGWSESFKLMHKAGDDTLIDRDTTPNSWDDREWEW